jgi:small subunit ribosomal protein S2e
VTKLGRLVKEGRIRSLEEIFLHSMPIKEHQIVDHFFPPTAGKLKDEVMTIKPVQKQSSAGQRTRFKAYVAVGDFDGHIGLGKKCSSEVATAIRGALIMAKMHLVPIRRGYWGKNSGLPHTIPMKLSGTCGSVSVRLIPAPRGTGLVAAPASKKILAMAGLEDCYSTTRGHSRTTGNFITAVFNAVSASYGYLSPELWKPTVFSKAPFQEHTDFLAKEAESAKADAAY